MDAVSLCPAPAELRFDQVVVSPDAITVVATARRAAVPCPLCRGLSRRIHSGYIRTLADLPWHGRRVRLEAHVRRFFCDTPGCRRRIFTERLPDTAASHARRTTRAAAALEVIGFALGGRPGARLAAALGLVGGAWAILAHVRAAPEAEHGTPRVLGVDDWSLRRGQRFGTILLDLERHAVIDLLPDREAATFAAWLRAHPGVELISRDRGGAYAEGARQGAPHAVQIADRFHLLRNLMAALERACTRHQAALRTSAEATHPKAAKPLPKDVTRKRRYSGLPANRPGPTKAEQLSIGRRARRLARYEQVVALRAGGMSKSGVARTLGLDRRTVDTWLAAGRFPERAPRARPPHVLERFADFIAERYDAGLDNGAQLARELRARGFTGNDLAARRYLAELRRTRPRGSSGPSSPTGAAPPSALFPAAVVPSPRETAWLLRNADTKPDDLSAEQRAYVTAVCEQCPALARARRLADEFVHMLERSDANALGPWLAAAEQSELKAFAAGIRRDQDAVLAAVLFQWSNGQVEGQVHRLKLLKRAMYGRASFALLRKRVLRAA
ncbi:MAG: ISL3 family transposase [Gemmatimonadaceae bacterium]